jgi:hypothetical protein
VVVGQGFGDAQGMGVRRAAPTLASVKQMFLGLALHTRRGMYIYVIVHQGARHFLIERFSVQKALTALNNHFEWELP